jgi:4-amino-4-deoxy-L-arabinose transferase-like glycosyltransferase
MTAAGVGRNDPCPCGSGRKVKHCCAGKAAAAPVRQGEPAPLSLLPHALILGVVVLVTVIVRIRLLSFPLERDEGEYAYLGQLLLQGIPPYQDAYTMKPPGIYGLYALAMLLFGETTVGVHLGLLLANAGAVVFLVLLARELYGFRAAALAGAGYALLSLSPTVLGFAGHVTQFIALFVLAGTYLLMKALRQPRPAWFWLSGALIGSAALLKPHAVFFGAFAAAAVVLHGLQQKPFSIRATLGRLAHLAGGGVLPGVVALGVLAALGVFDPFWFWNVQYASQYSSLLTPAQGLITFRRTFPSVVRGFELLWVLGALGLPVAALTGAYRGRRLVLLLFLCASAAAVVPGLYFRRHYFVVLLPALALAAGVGVDAAAVRLSRCRGPRALAVLPLLVWAGAMIAALVVHWNYCFVDSPAKLSRNIYGLNPFVESPVIAAYIKQITAASDRVAVFGSEPQICFHAQRRSATGHIYMYGPMEAHRYAQQMRDELRREVERANPAVVVLVSGNASWLRPPGAYEDFFQWITEYCGTGFETVGVADILPDGATVYRWGKDAAGYSCRSASHVLVLRRRALSAGPGGA